MRVTAVSFVRRVALAFAVAGAVSLAGEAGAQSAANFYIGGAYGQAKEKDACNGVAGCDARDRALGVFAGYWLHPSLALEAGYYNLGSVSAPGGSYIRSNVWDLVGIGAWHANPVASLYAKFGLFRGAQEGGGIFAAQKELVTGITYGAGAQFDLARGLGLRAEWQNYPRMGGGPVLPHGDVSVLRVGALWRFR